MHENITSRDKERSIFFTLLSILFASLNFLTSPTSSSCRFLLKFLMYQAQAKSAFASEVHSVVSFSGGLSVSKSIRAVSSKIRIKVISGLKQIYDFHSQR